MRLRRIDSCGVPLREDPFRAWRLEQAPLVLPLLRAAVGPWSRWCSSACRSRASRCSSASCYAPPPAGHLMTGGDDGPGVASMARLIRPTARRTTTSFSTSRLDSSSLLLRSLLPRDPWCGCFWISFSTATYSFSTATYSLLLSAFVCVVAHPCGVKSHGSALLASVCISSHQSARASWLTWLVRLDPCHSREPLAYMHHDSCARVSVLAMPVLCCSACLC